MKSRRSTAIPALLAAAFAILPSMASADPIVGQVDTFEDGTTQGWLINLLGIGSPPPEALPANVPTGGPGGAGDHYLQLTSLGTPGAGGRLVALNLDPRWTGDFVAAGVGSIALDVNNLGTTDLSLRLLFEHVGAAGPTDVAISAAAAVAAGGGWSRVVFAIAPGDLTALVGGVDAALRTASVIRLVHSPTAAFPGPPVAASLGVDNITALPVPEPASAASVALGLAAVGLVAARRRRRTPADT